jgi:hypothetical protein
MKKIGRFFLTGLAMGVLMICSSGVANAYTITDTLEDIGSDGTEIETRVMGSVTVTISTSGLAPMVAQTYFNTATKAFDGHNGTLNAPLVPGNVSGTRFISSNTGIPNAQPIIFDFSEGVFGFGLTTLDLLESPNSNEFVTLEARNLQGSIIDSQTRNGDWGDSGLDLDWFVSSSKADIFQVWLLSNIPNTSGSGYGIDDLIMQPVPVPSSILLLCSGIAILAGIRRSKK